MACIYKPKGSSSYVIEIVDQDGRRRRFGGGKSYALAKDRADALASRFLVARECGLSQAQIKAREADEVSLSDHVQKYVAHLEHGERSPRYVRASHTFLARIGELLKVSRLSAIDREGVEAYLQAEKKRGLSARTVNSQHALLCAFLNWCSETRRIPLNPIAGMHRKKERIDKRYRRRPLVAEEVARVFRVGDAVGNGRGCYYRIVFFTALRRSEAARLTWSDVDLVTGTLKVTLDKADRGDSLPIVAPLLAALARWKEESGPALPTAPVFPDPPRWEVRLADFERAGIAAVDDSDRHADLHAFGRTTVATMGAKLNLPPTVIAKIMRHSPTTVTETHYIVHDEDDVRAGIEAIAAPVLAAEAKLAIQDAKQAAATGTDGEQMPVDEAPEDDAEKSGANPGVSSVEQDEAEDGRTWGGDESPGASTAIVSAPCRTTRSRTHRGSSSRPSAAR